MKKEMMRIMTTATRIFAIQGLQATTIDNISRHCQIKKREFYTYFESKEALIREIIAEWISKNGKHLRMVPSLSFNAVIELQTYFRFVEETLATLTPAMVAELQTYYTGQWLKLSYFMDTEVFPFVVRNIERGLSENVYKPETDKLLLARLYYHQVRAVYHDKSLLHEMHCIFINGIVNSKGMHFT
ncbi:TetR/AcrR family transcriptional regulator [Chitinophaga sp.]|uniref:TetR/AcrR family transcriptional regulator n=1 Tax=Chitinophaga sp. TaxID=1869181 RepID=UPI0031CDCA0B